MIRKGWSGSFFIGFTFILVIAAAVGIWYGEPELESIAAFSLEDMENDYTQILLSQDASQVQGNGAEIFGNRVEITKSGTYVLQGSLEEGKIHVAVTDEEVTLILAGMEVTNTSEEAIEIEYAKQVVMILEEGTDNRIQSGTEKAITVENDGAEDEEIEATGSKGAIYGDCDLTIRGTGSLEVLGFLNNGIHVTGNLLIENGTFQVQAVNHGIKGKSSVTIQDGDFTILSGKDGIKSDQDTGTEYGWVSLKGGIFQIESQGDGVQAETALDITGGTYQITAGGGSRNASQETKREENPPELPSGEPPEHMGELPEFNKETLEFREGPPEFTEETPESKEEQPGRNHMHPEQNEAPFNQEDKKELSQGQGMEPEVQSNGEEDMTVSTKGFKSKTQMQITGGTFSVDTQDDAFHSDGSIRITGGDFVIASGDDGIHANTELIIESGIVQVDKCYEGLEANQLLIQGGDITITSSDDGVNAYGGSSNFGMNESSKTTEELPNFRITGGRLTINADGDGLDSNGNILIEGGEILVDGPANDGNGAIDSGSESGGTCKISGGTILAIGCSGMAETFEETSDQYSFCHNFSDSFEAGEEIQILDDEGTILYNHTAAKSGNSIVFSCPELIEGGTYTVYAGEQSAQLSLDSVSTQSGEQNRFGGGFGGRTDMQPGGRNGKKR